MGCGCRRAARPFRVSASLARRRRHGQLTPSTGGSVGAHVDKYDVFLLQGLGQRRWRISTDRAGAPRHSAATPNSSCCANSRRRTNGCWNRATCSTCRRACRITASPSDACLTYSIGMRAPSRAELMIDFAGDVRRHDCPKRCGYGDADLLPTGGDGEIDEAAMRRVLRAMPWLKLDRDSAGGDEKRIEAKQKRVGNLDGCSGNVDASMLRTWFGRFITRYRSAHAAAPRARKLADSAFAGAFAKHARAMRNPWSRAAWMDFGRDARLFVAGDDFACSRAFARSVCGAAPLALDAIKSAARPRRPAHTDRRRTFHSSSTRRAGAET